MSILSNDVVFTPVTGVWKFEKSLYKGQKSMSLQYIKTGEKEFLNLVSVLTLHIDPQILKITIIGSKIKVVVNFIYGYQNLSGEKYKTNEKN